MFNIHNLTKRQNQCKHDIFIYSMKLKNKLWNDKDAIELRDNIIRLQKEVNELEIDIQRLHDVEYN